MAEEIADDSGMRLAYLIVGILAVAVGTVGIVVPLLPTVPFYILAAWAFARSNPAWEARLLRHPVAGPHIRAWRERGAISRRGKIAATAAFVVSAAIGLAAIRYPWSLTPLAVAGIGILWINTRPA